MTIYLSASTAAVWVALAIQRRESLIRVARRMIEAGRRGWRACKRICARKGVAA